MENYTNCTRIRDVFCNTSITFFVKYCSYHVYILNLLYLSQTSIFESNQTLIFGS
ncbi:hypothetical protein Hanom_Chr02g00103561 [Helianthus anomalus]